MGFMSRQPAQYDSGAPATMMGPNSSGRIAAVIMICQPAWQLPTTTGRPSACGCRAMISSRKRASARITSSTVWVSVGCGRKVAK
ncbi:Uncharacterised protein [Bordetella pertussis]|nr:Uncharacterised protein [Bordetella pertussis]CFM00262.1 Uncharacterised protein [Bordetella pertussis]CFM09019.1 Uncharacterised protein [Bordetella pertussis]CFM15759.1 Uncharacterised protein [Bordetella pertussis]CFM31606.1 Uncharacterised protein [Bordetella pertussis]